MSRTADREARRRIGAFEALKQVVSKRYYLSFSVKGSFNFRTRRYDRYVWPKLFFSREAAEVALRALPVFQNTGPTPQRGRIVSVSIECVRVAA